MLDEKLYRQALTEKPFRALGSIEKREVLKIVRRHVAACLKLKVQPDLRTALREAVQFVRKGEQCYDLQPQTIELAVHYHQYFSGSDG